MDIKVYCMGIINKADNKHIVYTHLEIEIQIFNNQKHLQSIFTCNCIRFHRHSPLNIVLVCYLCMQGQDKFRHLVGFSVSGSTSSEVSYYGISL